MSLGKSARDAYLESQVLTATPQKLRLMLIDGAIRVAVQARRSWVADEPGEEALEAVNRCRSITAELLSSVRDDDELSKQVASLYLFLFRELTETQLRRDRGRLETVIDVLEVERETWRQFCERNPEPADAEALAKSRGKEVTAGDVDAIPTPNSGVVEASTGFSLEA